LSCWSMFSHRSWSLQKIIADSYQSQSHNDIKFILLSAHTNQQP
jgi:hypothetical protein